MNKYAVITGASSGIGLEFAKLMAADHYDLLIAARDKKGLEIVASELENEHNITVDIAAIDLSVTGAADKLWKHTKGKNVDVLVNSAGFGDWHPLTNTDWSKLESMIELNITTLTRLSQLAAVQMKSRNSGRILNIASSAGFLPGPGAAVYYASKAYVLSFTEALSHELSTSKVSVTALCPGPTKTNFSAAADADNKAIFTGNLPTASDVAEYGYKSMNKGKVVAVHGLKSKFSALIVPRLLPRRLIRKIVDKAQNN